MTKTKFLKFFTLAFACLISWHMNSYAQQRMEKSEAFLVTAMPSYYKVISPVKKRGSRVAVVIKNRTLSTIRGKFVDDNDKNLKFVTIKPDAEMSIEFDFNTKNKFYFVPLDPSFQRVVLNIGKSAYEIPSQE
ncbi:MULTISPECIES: hypothetical protein [Halobacteriovorax]|uniref:DUF2846 domain-containing protein n=1 Tax=Halobacteriovorax vibrionivorans TaxID=2152716 RepID=A0ABY0IDK0_9BACT|nr:MULTISPECIES: hypothetical protein [Halobacteriovorax]AYF44971.1 hypothetical protein BALOs_1972 [Halobacteriovorax sp. BALOs_7]RZF21036.1 hypothetical protein DAY19_13735 [Halobacteriovorax vibrionivorans]TGD48050.1 hypothetical protein EP118_05345 [Halobacteriovorax sp. Y22]